jgi:RNA polymerase sigma-70 factor (ECF subfamily)
VILTAQSGVATGLDRLCEHYRAPLVAYLRVGGTPETETEDLVQGFFEHLLSRDFLEGVDRGRGRFRTFLIASLKNFLRDHHDKASAQKRGGGVPPVSLDSLAEAGEPLATAVSAQTPDSAYDRIWADTVIGNAVRKLAEECGQARRAELFEVLEPILYQDETAGSYHEAGTRLGISEGAARVAAKRLRDRLRYLIRAQVRQTVATEEEVDSELRYLIELAGRR